MRYLHLLILLLALSPLFPISSGSGEAGEMVEAAFNSWDEERLLELAAELDEPFLLCKIQFKLAAIERTREGDFRAFLQRAVDYGEESLKEGAESPELLYYLIYSYNRLIKDAATFFKYKERITKYNKRLLNEYPGNFYSLLYNSYFHLTYDLRAGADRKAGLKFFKELSRRWGEKVETLNLKALYHFENYRFEESTVACKRLLELAPNHLEAQKRLAILKLYERAPLIKEIVIVDRGGIKRELLKRFLKERRGRRLSGETVRAIKRELSRFRLVSNVKVSFREVEGEMVVIELHISSNSRQVINIAAGMELVFDQDDLLEERRVLNGIFPPLFYYSNNNLMQSGLVGLTFYSSSGLLNNISFKFNLLERLDLRAGLELWNLPVLFSQNDYSRDKHYRARINRVYLTPSFSLGKLFHPYRLSLFFHYSARLNFLLIESPDSSIERPDLFTPPPIFTAHHRLELEFMADLVNLLELGWVREGFQVRLKAGWLKQTPDLPWGYHDFPNRPSNLSFYFELYGEYSKFINNIFYFSLGLHYRGGIELYKSGRFSLGKGVIGLPFDRGLKIHGFKSSAYRPDHLVLLNTLWGFKVNRHFHPGLYLDLAAVIERNSTYYLVRLEGSDYYNNLLIGTGLYFRTSPGWMFDILFEVSLGIDTGRQRLNGPVLGLYLSKLFLSPFKKR